MSDTCDIDSIVNSAIDEFKERIKELEASEEPGDMIHEIADGRVPIYTNQLLEVALSDLTLATLEPEL